MKNGSPQGTRADLDHKTIALIESIRAGGARRATVALHQFLILRVLSYAPTDIGV